MAADAGIVHVRLAPLLLRLFPDAEPLVDLEAGDVGAMIDALDLRWPGMADCIRDSSPAVRRHISIFVDGRRATLDKPLPSGTDVFIMTAISGG
jgi:molybdopterin synthase sulfur carrier subunit